VLLQLSLLCVSCQALFLACLTNKMEKEKLKNQLKDIQTLIDDIKLESPLDVKELKRLINERSSIEFKLSLISY